LSIAFRFGKEERSKDILNFLEKVRTLAVKDFHAWLGPRFVYNRDFAKKKYPK